MKKFELNLELPFPVSVNQYYRAILRGKFCTSIMSAKGREFKQRVSHLVADSERQPTDKPVMVIIKLFPPSKRRYDVDNMLKSLLDSLIGIAYDDDSQIQCLAISKEAVTVGGKCTIKIREV
jgi:crossover junction endodeoxyribonuclease RusA